MGAVLRALKAVYNFFAGDAFILIAVILAFTAAFLLARVLGLNALAAAALLALIVAGLTTALARERGSRRRVRTEGPDASKPRRPR